MARATAALANFNAGEFSPLLDGRTDIQKYAGACALCLNFIPTVQGPARRRPGTRFIREIADSSKKGWLSSFRFNVGQSFILEWGDTLLTFYTNHGTVLGTPVWAAPGIPGTTVDNDLIWINRSNPSRTSGTVYPLGQLILDPNGYIQKITTAGTSAGTAPTFSTVLGATTADGPAVFWTNMGNAVWQAAHAYALNDLIVANGFIQQVNGTSGAGLSGPAAYSISTPYSTANLVDADGLFALRFAQVGDVVYIANTNGTIPLYKLSRLSNSSWTLTEATLQGGPFQPLNSKDTPTMYAGAQTGSTTVTASSAVFTDDKVGSLLYLENESVRDIKPWMSDRAVVVGNLCRYNGVTYICFDAGTSGNVPPTHLSGDAYDGRGTTQVGWTYQDPGYGWGVITAVAGDHLSCTVTVGDPVADIRPPVQYPVNVIGAGNPTSKWAFGAINAAEGYPTHVRFFRERLTLARDQHVWTSVSSDFENFNDRTPGGLVTEDMGISITIPTQEGIAWLQEGTDLAIGTSGDEFIVGAVNASNPLGPSNIQVKPQGSHGSRAIQAVRIGYEVVYVQAAGRKLRNQKYDFYTNTYSSEDLTVLAEHITLGGIVQMIPVQEPDPIVWCVRDDGTLIGFTYNVEQQVTGWHQHDVSGEVESIATIPSPDSHDDDLWMIVKRTINGGTKRYIEYITPVFESDNAIEDAFFVDCGLTYDGDPATVIFGLDHLEGETVTILADGMTHPTRVVTVGSITLTRAASKVQAGYSAPCDIVKMRIEAGGANGPAQSKIKRVDKLNIRFVNTLGGKYGEWGGRLDQLMFRKPSDPMDVALQPFTGDKTNLAWPDGYTRDGRLEYYNDEPLPVTIVAFYPSLETQDGG